MASPLTSPGTLRLQAMIWEPQPINVRPTQDITMVHSPETLSHLPKDKAKDLESFPYDPASIILKRAYKYRHTFLLLGTQPLQTSDPNLDFLFPDGKACNPERDHQTFQLEGSLFGTFVPKPRRKTQGTTAEDVTKETVLPDATATSWQYLAAEATSDGVDEATVPDDCEVDDPDNGKPMPQELKTRILMPQQNRMSQNVATKKDVLPNGSPSSATGTTPVVPLKPVPIHWKAVKTKPLFQGEDFWVEFRRTTETFDPIPPDEKFGQAFYDSVPAQGTTPAKGIQPGYETINPYDTKQPSPVGGGSVYTNQGVIELDENGAIIPKSRVQLDLSTQPYYMIEIGGPSEIKHRYIILLAHRTFPKLIHIGNVPQPVIEEGKGLKVVDVGLVSRVLSTYDINSRTLMDQKTLRITVRNHLGRLAIYFSGYEDRPWVIDRSDLQLIDQAAPTVTTKSTNPADFAYTSIPMIVPEKPIHIAVGNLACAWCFAPLHYQREHSFTLPQVIAVRGPADDGDINLYLREKANRDTNEFQGRTVARFFQEAEVYIEDSLPPTSRIRVLTPAEIKREKAPKKDKSIGAITPVPKNSHGDKLSFLRVKRKGSIAAPSSPSGSGSGSGGGTSDGPVNPELDSSVFVRWFYVEYSLGSGDYTFDDDFTLKQCITPISTGWRIFVPAGAGPANFYTGVDVSHHVLNLSTSNSYTDASRCDSSGSIRFHIPAGLVPPIGPDGPLADYSDFLAELNNKTFPIRLYAWWDTGFMKCEGDCASGCCNCHSDAKRCAIFTGLCHAGEITVSAGKRVMDCQLTDYWKILADGQFLNCPFYDGSRDYNAVYDILQQAGFRAGDEGYAVNDPWAPAALLRTQSNHVLPPTWVQPFNGDTYLCKEFGLPSSYDILQSPFLKFGDNSHMDEGIMRIASLSGKVAYFDRYGIFHLDMRPDIAYNLNFHKSPRATFYASPNDMGNQKCNSLHQIMLDQYKYKRMAADVYNEIQIVSATPEGALIIGNDVNYASKFDPSSEGYLGYTKRLLQMDGIFGSEIAVKNVLEFYKGSYRPAILVNFTAFGSARLKAMDIVRVKGLEYDATFPSNSAPPGFVDLVITSIQHDMSPQDNQWKMQIEGEWVFTGPN